MIRKVLLLAAIGIAGVIATPSRTGAYGGYYHVGYTHYSPYTGLHHYGYTEASRGSYGAHYGYHYGGYRYGGDRYGYYRR
jgi:hypothetical protein